MNPSLTTPFSRKIQKEIFSSLRQQTSGECPPKTQEIEKIETILGGLPRYVVTSSPDSGNFYHVACLTDLLASDLSTLETSLTIYWPQHLIDLWNHPTMQLTPPLDYIRKCFDRITAHNPYLRIDDKVRVTLSRDFSRDHPETIAYGRVIYPPQIIQYTILEVMLGKSEYDLASNIGYNQIDYDFPPSYPHTVREALKSIALTSDYYDVMKNLRSDPEMMNLLNTLVLEHLYNVLGDNMENVTPIWFNNKKVTGIFAQESNEEIYFYSLIDQQSWTFPTLQEAQESTNVINWGITQHDGDFYSWLNRHLSLWDQSDNAFDNKLTLAPQFKQPSIMRMIDKFYVIAAELFSKKPSLTEHHTYFVDILIQDLIDQYLDDMDTLDSSAGEILIQRILTDLKIVGLVPNPTPFVNLFFLSLPFVQATQQDTKELANFYLTEGGIGVGIFIGEIMTASLLCGAAKGAFQALKFVSKSHVRSFVRANIRPTTFFKSGVPKGIKYSGAMGKQISQKKTPSYKENLRLNITPFWESENFLHLMDDNIAFVHGSNSKSLEGVARYGLLSIESMAKTPWFKTHPIQSGERGHTFFNLKYGEKGIIIKGIHMNRINRYKESLGYAAIDCLLPMVYPILFGLGAEEGNTLLEVELGHAISKGDIPINRIKVVYVPTYAVGDAQTKLKNYGSPTLARRVKPLGALDHAC